MDHDTPRTPRDWDALAKSMAATSPRKAKAPGRENAPAECNCPWDVVRLQGCQCPGYVPYRKRVRGY